MGRSEGAVRVLIHRALRDRRGRARRGPVMTGTPDDEAAFQLDLYLDRVLAGDPAPAAALAVVRPVGAELAHAAVQRRRWRDPVPPIVPVRGATRSPAAGCRGRARPRPRARSAVVRAVRTWRSARTADGPDASVACWWAAPSRRGCPSPRWPAPRRSSCGGGPDRTHAGVDSDARQPAVPARAATRSRRTCGPSARRAPRCSTTSSWRRASASARAAVITSACASMRGWRCCSIPTRGRNATRA